MGRQCRDESVGSGHPEPARLTGGEHMMVYLRTLAGNATSSPGLEVGAHVRPKITVCDELCGGLDPRMRQRVKRIKNVCRNAAGTKGRGVPVLVSQTRIAEEDRWGTVVSCREEEEEDGVSSALDQWLVL